MVTVDALIEMLWPDSGPDNPQKSLYTLMSRLRKTILSDSENQYILYRHDSYQWNPYLKVDLDIADFEHLVKLAEGTRDDKEKISLLEGAVNIYTGDYLGEVEYEIWVLPVTNYYKRLYLRALNELTSIYSRHGMQDEIIQLCSKAIEIEPFEESLHEHAIHALFINGDIVAAKKLYNRFTESVRKEFGADPSEEFRISCQSVLSTGNKQLNLAAIKRKLEGESTRTGAYFCTADIFNQFYAFDKRSDERMKFPVFLALITLETDASDDDQKAFKNAMYTLRQCLIKTLRTGDVISQYSKNQFLLMLSARVTDEAKAAMVRVKRIFEEESKGTFCKVHVHLSQIGK